MACWILWSLAWHAGVTQPTYQYWAMNLASRQLTPSLINLSFFSILQLPICNQFRHAQLVQRRSGLDSLLRSLAHQCVRESQGCSAGAGTTKAVAHLRVWARASRCGQVTSLSSATLRLWTHPLALSPAGGQTATLKTWVPHSAQTSMVCSARGNDQLQFQP